MDLWLLKFRSFLDYISLVDMLLVAFLEPYVYRLVYNAFFCSERTNSDSCWHCSVLLCQRVISVYAVGSHSNFLNF